MATGLTSSRPRRARPWLARLDERRLRRGAGLGLLLCLAQASFGLGWDIEWHIFVGRDTFWSPPHLLLYSGITLAGLLCVVVVLLDNWRYWLGVPDVDDDSTVRLPGGLRAPLGFALAGFGMLTLLLAAPLDDYWHQLYGIDVELWAPFHTMGLIGGGIAGLGLTYALASEAARARRAGAPPILLGLTALDLLALFALSGLARTLITAARPALARFPTTELGPVAIMTAPWAIGLALVFVSVTAVRMTRCPGAASVLAVMVILFTAAVAAFVPWGIRLIAEPAGLEYRTPLGPRFNVLQAGGALLYLLPALAVDLALARLPRRRSTGTSVLAGLLASLPAGLVGATLAILTLRAVHGAERIVPTNIVIPPEPGALAVTLGVVATVLVSPFPAWLGSRLGSLLYLNTR